MTRPADELHRAANAALAAGELDQAADRYGELLRCHPGHGGALLGLGLVAQAQGRPEVALSWLDAAATQSGAAWQVHNARAVALAALGQPEPALAAFDQALVLQPDEASLHLNRGTALAVLQRDEAALASFLHAAALSPGTLAAWRDAGTMQMRLRRFPEALATFDQLLARAPDLAAAHRKRGEALLELSRPAEALAAFDAAAARAPLDTDGLITRAAALAVAGQGAAALAVLDGVLAEHPHSVPAHWTAAFVGLATGDYPRGWREYEWRWHRAVAPDDARYPPGTLWLGDRPLAGRTILLHAEQGFGDTIQFCRYAPLVRAMGARVILEAPAPLLLLLRTLAGPDELVATGCALPPFDLHCPLMSLPLACGTTLATVPAAIPYLAIYQDRADLWRTRLGPRRGRARIGLAWSGLTSFKGDRSRSAPLQDLAALVRPGFDFVGMQRDVRDADLAAADALGIRLFGPAIRDFADSAALAGEMDLVISVDSAPAHLAGALGVPLWLLLPRLAEWRWLQDRTDSPWYPGATLFRQRAPGDWPELARRVGHALDARWPPDPATPLEPPS